MHIDIPQGALTGPEDVAATVNTNGAPKDENTNQVDLPTEKAVEMSDDLFAVLCFRNLIFDICMQNGGGHAGSAVGMAAIGVALWKYVMRYNPANPDWFDRDRFVLSNGTTHPVTCWMLRNEILMEIP
jgi:hypothetical protein